MEGGEREYKSRWRSVKQGKVKEMGKLNWDKRDNRTVQGREEIENLEVMQTRFRLQKKKKKVRLLTASFLLTRDRQTRQELVAFSAGVARTPCS